MRSRSKFSINAADVQSLAVGSCASARNTTSSSRTSIYTFLLGGSKLPIGTVPVKSSLNTTPSE